FHLGDVGQRLAGIDAGEVRHLGRVDFQHLANLVGDIAEPALATFEALLRARRLLARGADGFERRARGAVALGERILALRELIGGGAALRLRRFDLADERAPLLFERARGILEARPLALGFFDARFKRGDLRRRAVVARAPGLPVGGDRGEPPRGNLRFTRQRLRFRAHLGETRALAFDLAARAGKLRLDIGGGRQRFERALRLVAPRVRLLAVRGQARRRLAQRRQARRVTARLALGLGVPLARGLRRVLQRAPVCARRGLGLGGGGDLGLGGRHGFLFVLDLAPRRLELGLDLGEAVPARQNAPCPRPRHRRGPGTRPT